MIARFLRGLWYLLYHLRHSRKDFANEPHYFIEGAYIAIGENYERNHSQSRFFNRNESLTDLHELKSAHTLLVGVIASMLEENSGKKVPSSNEQISRRFVLTAAFIQGISVCEKTILEGQYLQAGTLIRQEYEGLTALGEIQKGVRKDGSTPNARYAKWKGSKHYGELSSFAHLSDHKILDTLVGYNTSWGDYASTVPQYQKINAARMYTRHTAYVLGLVEELQVLYADMYRYKCSQRESEVIDSAYSILVKYGAFKDSVGGIIKNT